MATLQFFNVQTNLLFNANLLVNDTHTATSYTSVLGGSTYTNVGYAGCGFATFTNGLSPPAKPSDWNIITGPYATASTTGGPLGAIF